MNRAAEAYPHSDFENIKKDLKSFDFRSFLVEISGIEPLTS